MSENSTEIKTAPKNSRTADIYLSALSEKENCKLKFILPMVYYIDGVWFLNFIGDLRCAEKMKNEDTSEHLILPHGGYCKLVTYKLGLLIYDATAAFCEHYFDCKDRTFDQMVQAARSGVANIVEGSQASATSKKT